MFVGACAVVLNQIAGYDDQISTPVVVPIVVKYRTQRRIGYGAAQISPGVGEQMRIRKVQYPQRVSCAFDIAKPRA